MLDPWRHERPRQGAKGLTARGLPVFLQALPRRDCSLAEAFGPQGGDACLLQTGFDPGRHDVGEGALEGDHVRPVDRNLRFETLALHVVCPFHAFGDSDQHLLWIAATQRAGAAIGKAIDARYLPASGGSHPGNAIATGAGPDHDQIKFLNHS